MCLQFNVAFCQQFKPVCSPILIRPLTPPPSTPKKVSRHTMRNVGRSDERILISSVIQKRVSENGIKYKSSLKCNLFLEPAKSSRQIKGLQELVVCRVKAGSSPFVLRQYPSTCLQKLWKIQSSRSGSLHQAAYLHSMNLTYMWVH